MAKKDISSYKAFIACTVELFDSQMNVFVFKNGVLQTVRIPAETAAETLVELCEQQEIYRLRLKGNETYLEGFIEEIRENEMVRYGNNEQIDIEIEEQ